MASEQRPERLQQVREKLHLPDRQLPHQVLVLICGLPGTGKSYLAHRLAERIPLVIVTSDEVRQILFDDPSYTGDEHYVVHQTCQQLTANLLREGYSVIFDATNLQRRHRQPYHTLAEEQGADLLILQTTAPPDVVRERLQAREENELPSYGSEADWEVYEAYRDQMEPIRRPHRVVDTSRAVDPVVEEIARQVEQKPHALSSNPRARLILNPSAGQSYRLVDLDETLGFLVRRGWELSLRETHRPNEAMHLAREAAEQGCDLVVAIGGDGTVNEVINGLAGSSTALAVLPMGSGNVWAREQGLPLEPMQAARALAQGQVRAVDLGQAGSRYFLLMASVGFDAAVVRALSGERQAFWPLGYILKGITVALNFASEETVITMDDHQIGGETVLVVIGNTRLYGGLVQITHQASIDDGLLDVCIFRGKGGLSLISLYALVALLRRRDRTEGVDYYRAKEVSVSSQTPLFVQTDGEPMGTTPITFRVVPRALQVLVPQEVPEDLFSRV